MKEKKSSLCRVLSFFEFVPFSSICRGRIRFIQDYEQVSHPIWPRLLSCATSSPLPTTGFLLNAGKSRNINAPRAWSGRIWARTLCGQDFDGKFSCATKDCGSGMVEFTLHGPDKLDFYDFSLVDGYNLPMLVVAKGGSRGGCSATGCLVDLNDACPEGLRLSRGNGSDGIGVACKSSCEVFGDLEAECVYFVFSVSTSSGFEAVSFHS